MPDPKKRKLESSGKQSKKAAEAVDKAGKKVKNLCGSMPDPKKRKLESSGKQSKKAAEAVDKAVKKVKNASQSSPLKKFKDTSLFNKAEEKSKVDKTAKKLFARKSTTKPHEPKKGTEMKDQKKVLNCSVRIEKVIEIHDSDDEGSESTKAASKKEELAKPAPQVVVKTEPREFPFVPHYQCGHCKYNSYARVACEEHIWCHCKSKPWHCGICFNAFGTRAMCSKHHSMEHKGKDAYFVHRPVEHFKAEDQYWHLKTEADQQRYNEFVRTRDPSKVCPVYKLADRDLPLTEEDLQEGGKKREPEKISRVVTLQPVKTKQPVVKPQATEPSSNYEKNFQKFLDGTNAVEDETPKHSPKETSHSTSTTSEPTLKSPKPKDKEFKIKAEFVEVENYKRHENSPKKSSKTGNKTVVSSKTEKYSCPQCAFKCKSLARFKLHEHKHKKSSSSPVLAAPRPTRQSKSKALENLQGQELADEETESGEEYKPDDADDDDDDNDKSPSVSDLGSNQSITSLKITSVKSLRESPKRKTENPKGCPKPKTDNPKPIAKVTPTPAFVKRSVNLPEKKDGEKFVYECIRCCKVFSYLDSLDDHMGNVHQSKLEWFPCPHCYISTRTKRGLYTHASHVHSNIMQTEEFEAAITVRDEASFFKRHIYTILDGRKHLVGVPYAEIADHLRPMEAPQSNSMAPVLPSKVIKKDNNNKPLKSPVESSTASATTTTTSITTLTATSVTSETSTDNTTGTPSATSTTHATTTSTNSETSPMCKVSTSCATTTTGSTSTACATSTASTQSEIVTKVIKKEPAEKKPVMVTTCTQTEDEVVVLDDSDDNLDDENMPVLSPIKVGGENTSISKLQSSEKSDDVPEGRSVDLHNDQSKTIRCSVKIENLSHETSDESLKSGDQGCGLDEEKESTESVVENERSATVDMVGDDGDDGDDDDDDETGLEVFNIVPGPPQTEPAQETMSTSKDIKQETEEKDDMLAFNVPERTDDEEEEFTVNIEAFDSRSRRAETCDVIHGLEPVAYLNYELLPPNCAPLFVCGEHFKQCLFKIESSQREEVLRHIQSRHARYKCGYCDFNLFYARSNALDILHAHHVENHPFFNYKPSFVYL